MATDGSGVTRLTVRNERRLAGSFPCGERGSTHSTTEMTARIFSRRLMGAIEQPLAVSSLDSSPTRPA